MANAHEKSWFTKIPALQLPAACTWGKNISQRRIYDSCKNIKWFAAGGGTGNYIINNGTVVFCNMEKSTDDPKLQTNIGQLNFKDVM